MSQSQGLLEKALTWAESIGRSANTSIIVDSGTLLGLMREGDLLSGDIDVDFSIKDIQDNSKKILEALKDYPVNVWRYDGRIYKITVAPGPNGPPMTAELKFFTLCEEEWRCPAIRSPGMWGRGNSKRSFVRRTISPVWSKVLRNMDAARFPLKSLAKVDTWAIPANYFDHLLSINDKDYCVIPADTEAYLAFRYGDWRAPVHEWISCRDDGGYRQTDKY